MGEQREGYHRGRGEWRPSPRQERILDAVCRGLTNDEIAEQLGISPDGVKWHVSELLGETGLSSRYELAEWWQARRHRAFGWAAAPRALKLALPGAAAAVVAVLVLVDGLDLDSGDPDSAGPEPSVGVDVGELVEQATPTPGVEPTPPAGRKPFFAYRQLDNPGLATIRLSGGGLEAPVTIPPIEFEAACADSTRNGLACSAGAESTTQSKLSHLTNRPQPDDYLPRRGYDFYRWDFVYIGADYDVPEQWYWYGRGDLPELELLYVPSRPPVVGPLPDRGWIELGEPVAHLVRRYITLAKAGLLSPEPTLEEALQASFVYYGGEVSLRLGHTSEEESGEPVTLPGAAARALLSPLAGMEPVLVTMRGNQISSRGHDYVRIDLTLGEETLSYFYVPPGRLAEEAVVLTSEAALQSWGYYPQLSPPGYSKRAYVVPESLDAVIAEYRPYPQRTLEAGIEGRIEPYEYAHWRFIERIEIWREGVERVVLSSFESQPCPQGCDLDYPASLPRGEPYQVAIWPKGWSAFRDLAEPVRYEYYADDGSGRGVLTQIDCPELYCGCCTHDELSFYPPPSLDAVLREAASRLPEPQ